MNHLNNKHPHIKSPALRTLLTQLETQPHVQGAGLQGSSPAFVIAAALSNGCGPFLVLTPDGHSATRLVGDLSFFLGGEHIQVLPYPEWDTAPYDGLSPHVEIPIQRIEAMRALNSSSNSCVVVASVRAAIKRVLTPKTLDYHRLTLTVGEDEELEMLTETLVQLGYLSTDRVQDRGSFSIRGGILDFFPPGQKQPIRVEFWDTEIEGIHAFDPLTGKNTNKLKSVNILPVREEILDPDSIDRALLWIRKAATERSTAPRVRRRMLGDIEGGVLFPNIEYVLPALAKELGSLLDYMPKGGRVVMVEPNAIIQSIHTYWNLLEKAYDSNEGKNALLPSPDSLFIQGGDFLSHLEQLKGLSLSKLASLETEHPTVLFKTEPTKGLRQTLLAHRGEGMLTPLVKRLTSWSDAGLRTYITCRTEVQAERLRDLVGAYGVQTFGPRISNPVDFVFPAPPVKNVVGPTALIGTISEGFSFPEGGLTLLADGEIFGGRNRTGGDAQRVLKNAIDSFNQLKEGDGVVHALHGIGLFRGITKLPVGDSKNDFVMVEYHGGDRLYLPIHRLNTLQRYVGQKGKNPKLDKMGGQTWSKTTKRVKERVLKIAQKLLDLYAARALAEGRAMKMEADALLEFEATFPHEETPDQLEAIFSVLQDMTKPQPMDRLLCGDVGFGKTEVAMRAAFLAVQNGYQVAILVPTTVLAFQHFQTFRQRFEPMAISCAQLSRFTQGVQAKKSIQAIKEGTVDIVIGTHRLLSRDVSFKRLGLLIIDEEHRFGVRHKEFIKGMRKSLDVLSMTATPIPRTLNMAMTGIRDFSVIATPPKERVPTHTQVLPFAAHHIKEAMEKEIHRGGQVFFIHNRVRSISAMAQYLTTLLPEVEIGVVHGQMKERDIEKAMVAFVDGHTDVLVASSIVESGLDIPRANTIIINRADQLGLAQLYQLRGRVGRSNRRAYAYLLTPAAGPATRKGHQRLQAMEKHTELGAGFKIANEDLELRGAGNLLGKSQSGSISAVGFETYLELLKQTIQDLKGRGNEPDENFDPDVDIKVDAFIPEEYLEDFQSRLRFYRRLSMAVSETELYDIFEELQGTFGGPPEPLKALFGIMQCRVMAKKLRISKILSTGKSVRLYFDETTPVSTRKLVSMAGRNPDRYKLYPEGRVGIFLSPEEAEDLVGATKNILRKLG